MSDPNTEFDQTESEARDIFMEAAELVSKSPKQAQYLSRMANLGTILQANGHAVEALWEEVEKRREHYMRQQVNRLVKSGEPVDQRKIDFERGLWYGAVLALVQLPREAKQALEKVQQGLDDETEEATA